MSAPTNPALATTEASPLRPPTTVPRAATAFAEAEGLAEQIAHFVLRKRQFPDQPHEALVVGKYYVLDKIDEGAMGIVCTALERSFGTVALKIPKVVGDARQRSRVLAEGQLLARVHHTNVLRVYEVGEWAGTIYIVTEYVEGQTLRAWQSAAGREWREIVAAYLQAARGLAAIHACRIIHQDIKPDNIRIDRQGTVRVLDFGLAHLETRGIQASMSTSPDRSTATRPSFYRGGTPGYMAPEQYHHDLAIDARADQFAFCAALWEALHGQLPYSADVIASTAVGVPRHNLGPPRAGEPRRAPRWLRAILLRGLAEDRERRFADMGALITAIERRLQRRWWPTLVLGAVTGLGAAGATAFLSGPTLPMCVAPEHTASALRDATREPELAAIAATLRDPTAARTWSALRDRLAAQRQRWLELHAAQCQRALAAGDPGAIQTREPCFAARRDELRLVADAMLSHARRHADDPAAWHEQRERWESQLGTVDDCLTPQPSLAVLAADHAAIDAPLRAARVAGLAGDPSEARPLLQQAIVAANRAGDRRRRAQARLELGRVDVDLHDNIDAKAQLLAAVRDADASGDDLTAADAESWLVHLQGVRSGDPDLAQSWFHRAMGRLERLELDRSPRAFDLHLRAASAALRVRHRGEAALLLAQAAEIRQALGPDERRLAREEARRAELAEQRGERAAGLALSRSALARLRGELGPHDHAVAVALRTLGQSESDADQTVAAERTLRQALASFTRTLGPGSIDAATVHIALAQLYYTTDQPQHALHHAHASEPIARSADPGHRAWQAQLAAIRGHLELAVTRRYDRAAEQYRRGIALTEMAAPATKEADNHVLMLISLAQAELSRRRVQDAHATMSRLLARMDRHRLPGEYRLYFLATAAEVALAMGQRAEAVRYARSALAELPEPTHPSSEAAQMLWLLARALGAEDPEGRMLAQRSRDMLRDEALSSSPPIDPAAIDGWLRERPAPAKLPS